MAYGFNMGQGLIIAMMLVGVAVALFVRWGTVRGVVTEPVCGRCGYCVLGLERMVCPECGGDLREVGIITPGTSRPTSRGKRLLVWTLMTPLFVMFIGGMMMPFVGPQELRTTSRRVIFSQVPYCNTTITVNSEGKKLVFGNHPAASAPPVTPEVMFLSSSRGTGIISSMDVRLPGNQFSFTDGAGKTISGTYDAKAIESWLNSLGYTDPRVADQAKQIAGAIAEMGTRAGKGYTNFSSDPMRNMHSGIAHPTFLFTRPESNGATYIFWTLLLIIVWLIGAVFEWRHRPQRQESALPSLSPPTTITP